MVKLSKRHPVHILQRYINSTSQNASPRVNNNINNHDNGANSNNTANNINDVNKTTNHNTNTNHSNKIDNNNDNNFKNDTTIKIKGGENDTNGDDNEKGIEWKTNVDVDTLANKGDSNINDEIDDVSVIIKKQHNRMHSGLYR